MQQPVWAVRQSEWAAEPRLPAAVLSEAVAQEAVPESEERPEVLAEEVLAAMVGHQGRPTAVVA